MVHVKDASGTIIYDCSADLFNHQTAFSGFVFASKLKKAGASLNSDSSSEDIEIVEVNHKKSKKKKKKKQKMKYDPNLKQRLEAKGNVITRSRAKAIRDNEQLKPFLVKLC